jgi:hypothetical protein
MKRVPGTKSNTEDDNKSESSQSQVLTREERQAMYEKTRARIFSDYVESQKADTPSASVQTDDGESESSPFTIKANIAQSKLTDSLPRSDEFQTRQEFARESTAGSPYPSYVAALTGQTPLQSPTGPGYPYPSSYNYQYPTGYHYAISQSSQGMSRDTSRPESRTSSPSITRNESPGFHPNPFAREFVPTVPNYQRQPQTRQRESTPPYVLPSATVSRNSTPPTVKKTSSFEAGSRPITPTPPYPRSQSATSMRPTPPNYIPAQPPTYYPSYPYQSAPLPFGAYNPPHARQYEWGPPITTGTIRYISNGQHSISLLDGLT